MGGSAAGSGLSAGETRACGSTSGSSAVFSPPWYWCFPPRDWRKIRVLVQFVEGLQHRRLGVAGLRSLLPLTAGPWVVLALGLVAWSVGSQELGDISSDACEFVEFVQVECFRLGGQAAQEVLVLER